MSTTVARGGTAIGWRVPDKTEPAVRRVTAAVLRMLHDDGIEEAGGAPYLLAGGDLREDAEAARWIWGGGLPGPGGRVPALLAERVLAVRGMLTADRLVAAGVRLREIPIGEIGLLAGMLMRPEAATRSAPIAVVPSAAGRGMPFFAGLSGSREACVVDLGEDSLEPLRRVAGAEVVVAQDLQGLVWAEAFGKPAVWVAARSDDEHDFRFRDWFSTVFERQERPVVIGGRLEAAVAEARRAQYARPVAELGQSLASKPTGG